MCSVFLIYIIICIFFLFILLFRFSTTNTMESTARIQIGARSDRNDEHVAGRVLYIGNLSHSIYIYIQIYGIFFKSLWTTTCCCGKWNFFRRNGHGLDFHGEETGKLNIGQIIAPMTIHSGTIFTYLLYFIIIICTLGFVFVLLWPRHLYITVSSPTPE